MLNTQPAEKLDLREDGTVVLHHAWRTLQGEGPLAGSPAVFFRLAGCTLACAGCDTEYTSSRQELKVTDAVNLIYSIHRKDLVVFTGGEPFRQNIGPLVSQLIAMGRRVQIETNGSLFLKGLPYGDPLLQIVCSPKCRINPLLRPQITAYKYVLQAGCINAQDGLPTQVLGNMRNIGRPDANVEVFVQPMDEQDEAKNKANLEATLKSCWEFGYRFSLQCHKILGLQ